MTLRTIVHQPPVPMEFSRQECWNGLPFSPSRDLPQGLNPHLMCHLLDRWIFTTEPPGKPLVWGRRSQYTFFCVCTYLNKPIDFFKSTTISFHFTAVENLLHIMLTVQSINIYFVWLLFYSVLLAIFSSIFTLMFQYLIYNAVKEPWY